MKISKTKTGLFFEGVLNEKSQLNDFSPILDELLNDKSLDVVELDVSQVTRANSSGIIVFLQFLQQIPIPFQYLGTPVWLVNQFNIISQFLPPKSSVRSLQVPFYCEETDEAQIFTLEIQKDIPAQAHYTEFEIPHRVHDNNTFEADITASSYLRFLSEISDRYK